jgi:leucyl/phenylalanyl-tRNA--protein transferase
MDLTPELLIHAYSLGVFPMAESRDSEDILWMDPKARGIMPLNGFHVSRSLAKAIARNDYEITLDAAFEDVMDACADRNETWISRKIRAAYIELFHRNHAHSLEVWRNGDLMGGVYGVSLGSAFFGESMFSKQTNGSKIALAYLTTHLKSCGYALFDTQYLTDHLASLGGVEIGRTTYREMLRKTVTKPEKFYKRAYPPSVSEVLQRRTQTS